MADDDGFRTIGWHGAGRETVLFQPNLALFTLPQGAPERADWQWDGNGRLRLRCHEVGQYRVGRNSARRWQVSTRALYRAIGRPLKGSYPARVDGHDLYITVGDGA